MLKHNSTGINKKYDEGETLLHIAVRAESIDVIQLLIDYGADIDAKDDNGMTTIDYAAKSGNSDLSVAPSFFKGLSDKLFADKAYISKALFHQLFSSC